MTLLVESPGMFTTVQDLGRPGYGPLGVSTSGAADPIALCLGNRLVGNHDNAAALELTMLGGAFVFPDGATIAVTGADFSASVPLWTAARIEPGHVVRLRAAQVGARAYLCVRGGIAVPPFLNSASTHALTGLGGYNGRALRRGDSLAFGNAVAGDPRSRIRPGILERLAPRKQLRLTAGPQWDDFSASSRTALLQSAFTVTEQSNRMGIRLAGPALDTPHGGTMLTEGVPLGAIQVPAGGHPIILFVEQQTTGGYPKIANVISADLASLGQLRPRDIINFQLLEPAEAHRLLLEQQAILAGEVCE